MSNDFIKVTHVDADGTAHIPLDNEVNVHIASTVLVLQEATAAGRMSQELQDNLIARLDLITKAILSGKAVDMNPETKQLTVTDIPEGTEEDCGCDDMLEALLESLQSGRAH